MSNVIKSKTGPKTLKGKSISSKNATKYSIFSKGYLSWEDKDKKQQEYQQLADQWNAYDPTKQMIIRSMEEANLSLERIMYAQSKKIEGLMMSRSIAVQFCTRAGINTLLANELPYWYFTEDGNEHKKTALYFVEIVDEAEYLKNNYSDVRAARAKEDCPNLYKYVMTGQPDNASFLTVLGHLFKKSSVILNLTQLINNIESKYKYYLQWAESHQRYQKIIDGLRAEQMEQAMEMDKMNRYATSIQNRIVKSITTLAAMDQHEELMASRQQLIEVEDCSDVKEEVAEEETL